MTTEPTCLDSLEEVQPEDTCPLDVWVRLPADKHGSRYLKRKRYRTYREIYNDMHKHLDRIECEKCGHTRPTPKGQWYGKPPRCEGCGESDWFMWLDEYDSNGDGWRNEDAVFAQPDEEIVHIMCYSNVGGNEGYQAHLSVLLRKGSWGERTERVVHLYWIKSFRGMQHVHKLVEHMMKATGAWPGWCK